MDVLLKLLVGGRKSQLSLLGIGLIVALGLWKEVPPETVMEYIVIITGAGMGSIALEDGLAKVAKTK